MHPSLAGLTRSSWLASVREAGRVPHLLIAARTCRMFAYGAEFGVRRPLLFGARHFSDFRNRPLSDAYARGRCRPDAWPHALR